jgi:two-component system NtrC family response regulator
MRDLSSGVYPDRTDGSHNDDIPTQHPNPETSSAGDSLHCPRLLIIEEKNDLQTLLKAKLPGIYVDGSSVSNASAEASKETPYNMLIWAAETSGSNRTKLLKLFSRTSRQTHVIIVSHEEPDPVSCGLRLANYQYIPRPVDANSLATLVKVALKKHPLSQNMLAYPEVRVLTEFEGMIGISLPMREIFQRILEAASADIPVLITGETGTGKELVAAAIHNRSKRKDKFYVPVNTGAIAPELIASELFGHEKGAYTGAIERRQGFFEQANGGTIFLDEISTMDEKAQIGLLRILETKTFRRIRGDKDIQVDVRVIAATNENLQQAIAQRRFREDLFYRLDVFRIHLPPLRARPGGVTLLTNHFVIVFNTLYQKNVRVVSPETYRCLRRYSWPGNIRELKNVIQRAVLMARDEELTLDLIPERIRQSLASSTPENATPSPIRPGMTLEAVEKEYIAMTLAGTQGNKKEAAVQLGISRRALYNKLAKHGLL